MARPTDLTPEVQAKIVQAIKIGNYVETAAAYAGIDKTTFYDWLRRGAAEPGTIYEEFSHAVEKADADAEVSGITRIRKAGVEVWQAEAWYMERRFGKRWALKQAIEHTGKDGGPIQTTTTIDLTQVSDADLAVLKRLAQAADPKPGSGGGGGEAAGG